MADFFSRLAARALGAAPVVRPNLPTRVTSTPALETSAEIVSPPPRAADNFSANREESGPPVDPAIAYHLALPPILEQQKTETAFRSPIFSPPRTEHQRGTPESAPEIVGSTVESAHLDSPSEPNFDTVATPYRPPTATEQDSHGVTAERIDTRPERAVVSSSEAFAPERSPSTPTVQVTIGRVEVRAVSVPAATSRAVERKPSPLLSLDQYLRERNEGRR